MGFISTKSNIKTLRPNEPIFYISGNVTITPRAGFEVSDLCPKEYASIIATCINRGWLKPVAYIRDDELMWEKLKG